METNIKLLDQGVRVTAAAVCIMSVVLNPFVPVWFALIGAYLVLTSIPAWDPVYAALGALFKGRESRVVAGSVRSGAVQH